MALVVEEVQERHAIGTAASAAGEVVRGLLASSMIARGAQAAGGPGWSAALACWVAQCQDLVDYFRWKKVAVRPVARSGAATPWRSGDDDDLVTMLAVMGVRLGA